MTAENQQPASRNPDFWDAHNPYAIVNLVPAGMARFMMEHYDRKPELFEMTESQLFRHLLLDNRAPGPADDMLRFKFWHEYDQAMVDPKTGIREKAIFANVVSESTWHAFMRSPYRMAWLLCLPTDRENEFVANHAFGMKIMRDILEMPHVEHGKVNTSLIAHKIAIMKWLDLRLYGAPTQRIEQKTFLLSKQEHRLVTDSVIQGQSDQLDRRIAELEKRERQALHLPPPAPPVPVPAPAAETMAMPEVLPAGKPDEHKG